MRKNLKEIFELTNRTPGWLSMCADAGFSDQELSELEDLSDEKLSRRYRAAMRDREEKMRKEVQGLISEVMESDPAWARNCRLTYLQQQVSSGTASPSMERELRLLKNHPNPDTKLTDQEKEAARLFPIWKLLEKNLKEKVICPFHTDSTPSLYLYDRTAHCFTCGKTVDSIGWLMEINKMTFVESVKALCKL